VLRFDSLVPTFRILRSIALLTLLAAIFASPSFAGKVPVKDMYDVFSVEQPQRTPAVSETTIRHQVYFSDLEGNTSNWGKIDFRAGQPNAWHRVTGTQSCVGQAWWCGVTGLPFGDGYGNNWIQTLKTNTPINLAGSTGNVLTFKQRVRTEDGFDLCWVMIHDGNAASVWDTLAFYSGDLGASCVNASINIANSWTTRPQPIQLMLLFGSDLSYSRADSNDVWTGWSIDDVKVTASGSVVKFFDDNEGAATNWVASAPDPGTLWHIENSPGTSQPASCFFLSTNVWVPFAGFGFGTVPDFSDAMLYTPPIDVSGLKSGTSTFLRLQFDNWINLPAANDVTWSLWISGSPDSVTWTPWANALAGSLTGGTPQCVEGSYVQFDPFFTARTGIQPGTQYIRLGFRIRDERATSQNGELIRLGIRTEGIYFDNIGLYFIYTISGVEAVTGVPVSAHAAINKVYPNPFNPSTTVEFSVPKAGPGTVRIFDLQGRKVATLVNEALSAGVYRVRWNGKSDEGRDLSSGVYFARVEFARSRASARLLLVK